MRLARVRAAGAQVVKQTFGDALVVFAFVEDGSLEVKRDLFEVRRDPEAGGVENLVVKFYDQKGTPLKAVFGTPNRRHKLLGFSLALEEAGAHVAKVRADT